MLPPVKNTNMRPAAVDMRFPAEIPNGPFRIDQYVPANVATGDLVHRFYQEQTQIHGGRMDRFAAISDAGGLVMGYYDLPTPTNGSSPASSRWATTCSIRHSAARSSTTPSWSAPMRVPLAERAGKIVAKLDASGQLLNDGQVTPDGFAINTSRVVYLHAPSDTDPALLVPPQTMPHIGDRLDATGVDWAWYSGGYDDAMAGQPDPLFQFHHQPLAFFRDLAPGTPGQKTHLKDLKDLYAAIAAGTLPPVVFYKPIGELNLHPGYANITDGDEHLADLVAKLQASPQYAGHADHRHLRRAWRLLGPRGPAGARPLGPRHPRPADRRSARPCSAASSTTRSTISARILRTIEDRFEVQPLGLLDGRNANFRNLLQ